MVGKQVMSMSITCKVKDDVYEKLIALSEDRKQRLSETCRDIITEYFSDLSEKMTEEEYFKIFGGGHSVQASFAKEIPKHKPKTKQITPTHTVRTILNTPS